jgi:hypothetical protein
VPDEQGQVMSSWLFDPDGTVLEGPEGLVSHLICGGVYDWSTGLIFKGGRYFDPSLGIWLALVPLVVIQSWRGRKKRRRGLPWYVLVLVVVGVGGGLTACGEGTPGSGPKPTKTCITIAPGPAPMEDPRAPGPHDAAILEATVQISFGDVSEERIDPTHKVITTKKYGGCLGTIVGEEGDDWVIYTHHHHKSPETGKVLLSPTSDLQQVIIIQSWDGNQEVQLRRSDMDVEQLGTDLLKLRIPAYRLDGTGVPPVESGDTPEPPSTPVTPPDRVGTPISKEDSAVANVGEKVDLAYFAPVGDKTDKAAIWHTRIVERPTYTGPRPGTVAVLGAPVPGAAFGPGGHGDSGGGLFRDGVHIGNTLNWVPANIFEDTSKENIIGHKDAFWLSYLNP